VTKSTSGSAGEVLIPNLSRNNKTMRLQQLELSFINQQIVTQADKMSSNQYYPVTQDIAAIR